MLRIEVVKGLQSGQFCSIQKETAFELVTLHTASAAFHINQIRRCGGIGRRAGMRILCIARTGSSPVTGTRCKVAPC